MSDKLRRWAKILGVLVIFSVAVLIAAAGVWVGCQDSIPKLPFARSENAADDSIPMIESEIEKSARAWTANNINGVAWLGEVCADWIGE